jgi:hypothetical protein
MESGTPVRVGASTRTSSRCRGFVYADELPLRWFRSPVERVLGVRHGGDGDESDRLRLVRGFKTMFTLRLGIRG